MKRNVCCVLTSFLLLLPVACERARLRVVGAAPAAAPGGAPSPALPTLAVTFEIANFNYLDLDRALAAPPPRRTKKSYKVHHADGKEGHGWTGNTGHGLDRIVEEVVNTGALSAHEVSTKRHTDADSSLSQLEVDYGLRIEPLVRDVLRDTVRDVFDDIIGEYFSTMAAGPAAAAAAAPAALIATTAVGNATTGPAPAPAKPVHKVDVFVQFSPGRTRPLAETLERREGSSLFVQSYPNKYHYDDLTNPGDGKTTKVEVTITGKPETGADEMPIIEKVMADANKTGDLNLWLSAALYEAAGLIPKLSPFSIMMTKLVQWSTDGCAAHMSKVVKMFVMAYTRRMVPTAIYNECTNYAPLLTFSHDYIPNHLDTNKCREATIKFAKKWDFGKKKKAAKAAAAAPGPAAASPAAAPGAASAEFNEFCLDVCEAKFGLGAQQCHVTQGDELVLKGP